MLTVQSPVAPRAPARAAATLLPKEHGAYGQMSVPLLGAGLVGGASLPGLLIAAATLALFLAHEPLVVLLGSRGARARRELQYQAGRWLGWCAAVGAAAGGAAVVALDPAVRPALLLPAAPAVVLAAAIVAGREKSWYGEMSAALAFSLVAVPIVLAGGRSPATAAGVAIPFALLFTISTLAVRAVILRVRGGGDARAAACTRRAVWLLAAGAASALAALSTLGWLPWSVPAASMPGLLIALALAVRPPAPTHLRTVGWSLVAVSLLTLTAVVASH